MLGCENIPEIVVITVVYNGESTIEKTIKSVISQSYSNFKYYIIDGNSNDETPNIILRYKEYIDYYISAPDSGIYYAMNKAINRVKDDNAYLLFLNSDDYLFSNNSLNVISSHLGNHDFIYGKVLLFDEKKNEFFSAGKEMNISNLPFGMIQHQSTFTRKKLFSEIGHFDCHYTIAADFDFAIKVFRLGYKIKFVNEIVAVMKLGGISQKSAILSMNEKKEIFYKNYSGILKLRAILTIYFIELPRFLLFKLKNLIFNSN